MVVPQDGGGSNVCVEKADSFECVKRGSCNANGGKELDWDFHVGRYRGKFWFNADKQFDKL